MASRNLDGCRVIKAAEQRLAFAQNCEKIAQSQLEAAQKEVKEATSFLEETLDKLQVIDVDDDDDTESGDGKRKSKVSLSHNNGNGGEARTDANLAAASQPSVAPASVTSSNGDENVVEKVVVEGAGTSEVNGTYKLCQSHDDCLFAFVDRDIPVYSKSGSWNGNTVKFFIHRRGGFFWFVSCWDQDSAGTCCSTSTMWSFYANIIKNTKLPPKKDWDLDLEGFSPSPQLKW